jgi:hypothetical protein
VSLIPSVYASTDASAPALTGQAGSMAALLDAILVNGYGSGGSTKAPLGWTTAFTGTNLRAYRGNTTSGTGYFVRLDDTTTRSSRLRGFQNMTAISTGTGPTPTTAQRTNGSLWLKSVTTDSAARKWWAIGNERCFYLFIAPTANYPDAYVVNFAGDLKSIKPGDLHNFFLSTTSTPSFTGTDTEVMSNLFISVQDMPSLVTDNLNAAGHLGRNQAGTGGSNLCTHIFNAVRASPIAAGDPSCVYPYPVTGGMLWDRAWMLESAHTLRGYLPGLIVPFHKNPFPDLVPITDLPDFPIGTVLLPKTFVGYAVGYIGIYDSTVLFETGAWT